MKKFKMTLATAALAMLAVGSMLSMNSCKKDPCKDETCNDKGTPTANGDVCDCACNTGYEGDKCETEMRTKFVGTYAYNESCTSGTDTYTVSVATSSSSITEVSINNLYNQGIIVKGTVSGTALTIASQPFGSATISGTGSISGNTLSLSYSVSLGGATDACSGSGTK